MAKGPKAIVDHPDYYTYQRQVEISKPLFFIGFFPQDLSRITHQYSSLSGISFLDLMRQIELKTEQTFEEIFIPPYPVDAIRKALEECLQAARPPIISMPLCLMEKLSELDVLDDTTPQTTQAIYFQRGDMEIFAHIRKENGAIELQRYYGLDSQHLGIKSRIANLEMRMKKLFPEIKTFQPLQLSPNTAFVELTDIIKKFT